MQAAVMPPAPGGYDGGFGAPEAVTPFCARFHWVVKLFGVCIAMFCLGVGFALAPVAAVFPTFCLQSRVVRRLDGNWGWRDLVLLLNAENLGRVKRKGSVSRF